MRRSAITLLLLVALAPCGCFYVRATGVYGPVLDPEVVSTIVPGETTKAGVLELLGPPEEYVRSEVLDAMVDDTTRVAGAVAIGNRALDAFTYKRDVLAGRGAIYLFYNFADVQIESELVVIFFDAEDRVREVSTRILREQR